MNTAYNLHHSPSDWHMNTAYKRQKHVHNNLPYVEPQEIVIGSKLVLVQKGSKKMLMDKPETFSYIPVLETIIQQMLLKKDL